MTVCHSARKQASLRSDPCTAIEADGMSSQGVLTVISRADPPVKLSGNRQVGRCSCHHPRGKEKYYIIYKDIRVGGERGSKYRDGCHCPGASGQALRSGKSCFQERRHQLRPAHPFIRDSVHRSRPTRSSETDSIVLPVRYGGLRKRCPCFWLFLDSCPMVLLIVYLMCL